MGIRLTIFTTLFCLTTGILSAQGHFEDVDKFQLENQRHLISSIDVSPDGKYLAVATVQGDPIYILDAATQKTTATHDVDGYYAGPIIDYSSSGTYLLLEKQFYADWHMNKDKATKYEVMDSKTGKIIMKIENAQDAQISPDESRIAVIKKDKLVVYGLPQGNELIKKDIVGIKNALCYSLDGKNLFVTHKLTKEDAAEIPSLRNDKKAIKSAIKFQQGVSMFNSELLNRERVFLERFDNVYDLKSNHDGTKVYCFSKMHTRVGTPNINQGNILMFDIKTGLLDRGGFVTNMMLTNYGESSNGRYFGLVSIDARSKIPIVQICDPATSDILTYFNIDKGIFQGIKDGEFQGGQVELMKIIFHFTNLRLRNYFIMG